MTYRLKVNQQWKIVLALVCCPLFFTAIYIAVILQFRNLPDWAVLVSAFTLIGISLAATLFVIFRWLTVACEIDLSEQGFFFRLIRETPFMHLHEFRCNWENIENTALNEDRQNDAIFYSVRFRHPDMTLYLTDVPKQAIGDGTGSAFWQELSQYVDRHNNSTQTPSLVIGHTGFYEKPWAKALTYFTVVFSILIVFATIFSPGEGSWWRVAGFSAYAIPWLVNYYSARKKRKQYPGS